MTERRVRLICFLALATLVSLGPVLATAAPKSVGTGTVSSPPRKLHPPTTGGLSPLSATECGRLGGVIDLESACASSFKCTTVDQNHHEHSVCLTSFK